MAQERGDRFYRVANNRSKSDDDASASSSSTAWSRSFSNSTPPIRITPAAGADLFEDAGEDKPDSALEYRSYLMQRAARIKFIHTRS